MGNLSAEAKNHGAASEDLRSRVSALEPRPIGGADPNLLATVRQLETKQNRDDPACRSLAVVGF